MKRILIALAIALAMSVDVQAESLTNFDGRSVIPNISGLTGSARSIRRRIYRAPVVRSQPVHQFRAGFKEGYRTVKGNLALLPLYPLTPLVPIGSTPFREGIKAGIRAAGR